MNSNYGLSTCTLAWPIVQCGGHPIHAIRVEVKREWIDDTMINLATN